MRAVIGNVRTALVVVLLIGEIPLLLSGGNGAS